jgi:hypothetical protein
MLDLMGLDNNKNKSPPTENITLVEIISCDAEWTNNTNLTSSGL